MSSITTQQNFSGKTTVASVPTSYAALDPATLPTSGVLYNGDPNPGGRDPSLLRLTPFASTTGGTGVGMRVVGYTPYLKADGSGTVYVPTVLGDFTLTFSTGTVPTWTLDSAGDCRPYAGITQVAGTPTANLYSPGTAAVSNTEPASVLIDPVGCTIVQVQFKSSGSPTMGVLWATL